MGLIESLIIWIHLIAVSIWVGGSMFIGVVIGPYVRSTNMSTKERIMFTVNLGKRFNKIALPSLFILFITGIYNARLFILTGNINSTYGIILLIKVILVISMSIIYLLHVNILWKRIEKNIDTYSEDYINRARRTIINIGRLIIGLSITILLLASMLHSGL
jgi:uncharacterized membrane protein